jgi:Dolichyl-phosphate-mannose-protein mannosyltransferase
MCSRNWTRGLGDFLSLPGYRPCVPARVAAKTHDRERPMQQVSSAAEPAPDTEKPLAQQPQPSPPVGTESRARLFTRALFLLGSLVCLLSLAAPWARAGLWDPAEVRIADLARRSAIHLFGGESLKLSGAADLIPTVEEVARGEMPVLSIALSLRLFGNAVWAFRLPLLLWAILGLVALYTLCKRLADRETAWLAALVLITSPLYFVQARTGLGDIATMASVAVAFTALHLSWADATLSRGLRLAVALLGVIACVGGFFARGAWLGLAVPGLAAGGSWALLRVKGKLSQVDAYGAAALLLGLGGLAAGVYGFSVAEANRYSYALGSAVVTIKKLPTHDAILAQIGHGFFPWSALLPMALGAALVGAGKLSRERFALGVGLFLALVLAGLGHAVLLPRVGNIPFVAPFALAGLCALGLREVDRKAAGSPAIIAVTAALLVLLLEDFTNSPDKAFVAFAVDAPAFPEALVKHTKRVYQVVAGLGVVGCAVLGLERVSWFGPFVLRLMRAVHLTRSRWVAGPLIAGGLVLSWGFYPALAEQLSPAGVYQTYHREARPNEPLGVVGQAATQGSAFYAQGPVKALDSLRGAIDWLNAPNERRWLILKRKDLATANSLFRAGAQRGNLPIVDAASSEILLASNQLGGKTNTNPLQSIVLDAEPQPARPLVGRFGSDLELLGWEIREEGGSRPVAQVSRGARHEFRIFYKVLRRINTPWKTFIHIDGTDKNSNKRLNGDHDTTPAYPLKEWQVGDFIVDSHTFQADSEFPRGTYDVYFGLFNGAQRLTVSAGPQQDNRVIGGQVRFE